jgi:hypothetical protein
MLVVMARFQEVEDSFERPLLKSCAKHPERPSSARYRAKNPKSPEFPEMQRTAIAV